VSLSSGDEVPRRIFIRKSHLRPKEFLITSAKRLLQQNRHKREVLMRAYNVGSLRQSRPDVSEPRTRV
jgi:hypothetical protein